MSTSGGKTIVWHNGGTGGYRSFIGFNRAARTGVVVLSNAGTVAGIDDIGLHLLDPQTALLKIEPHTEVAIDPKLLDLYVGRYELATGAISPSPAKGTGSSRNSRGSKSIRCTPRATGSFSTGWWTPR